MTVQAEAVSGSIDGKKKPKPRMPDPPPKMKITLEVELLHDFGRYDSGHMMLTFADCSTAWMREKPKDGEEPKKAYEVIAAIGGQLQISVDIDKGAQRAWVLRPQALMDAVIAADRLREHELEKLTEIVDGEEREGE